MLVRVLVLSLLALCFSSSSTAAQQDSAEGTLVATVLFSPLREWELQPARCNVHVYEDLRAFTAPVGLTDVADPRLPIVATTRTGDQGRALMSLPPGRYSVALGDCDHWETFALANLQYPYYPYQCCFYFDGRPKPSKIRDSGGLWVMTVQHVEVQSGKLATAYFEEWGEDSTATRRDLFIAIGVTIGVLTVVGGIAGLIRPRYAPESNATNPKRYEPPSGERRRKPATFDDVFGEFKEKD